MEAQGRRPALESFDRVRLGPVALALVLSLVSTPFVAVSLLLPPPEAGSVVWRSMGLPAALLLAVLAVLPAGLLGGALGGRFVGGRPGLAVFLSLAVAWPVGISMLSVAAAALGTPLQTGIVCIDSCSAMLTDADPLSGVWAYLQSVLLGGITLITPILGLVLLVAARFAGRGGHALGGIVLVIAGYGLLHWASISKGGLIPFGCLAVGVVAWWYFARGRPARPDVDRRSIRPVEVIR
jgi:hypothetical protein